MRFRRHSRLSTGLLRKAPSGPPIQRGKTSFSFHWNWVRPPVAFFSVKTPVPVTTPVWRTPIDLPGTHWVISITSVSLKGPTLVSHSKVVPTPEVWSPTKRIAVASAIHSTWLLMWATSAHTSSGGASSMVTTRIFAIEGDGIGHGTDVGSSTMRRLLVSSSVVLAVLALGVGPSAAGDSQDTMAIDPTSGPPGTEISVVGTGCVTKGDVEVVVELLDTSDVVQDSTTVEPSFEGFSGDWEATLTVPADTTDFGEWTVTGLCQLVFAEPTAVSAAGVQFLIDYIPRGFTVTAPPQEPPADEPPAALPIDAAPTFTG